MVNRVRLLILVAVLIPVLIFTGAVLLYDSAPIGSSPGAHFKSFSVGGKTFPFTYVATNESALYKGLMGVNVTDTTTELFVFPNASYYGFWMYGMNSSLDIMWVYVPPGTGTGTFVYLALGVPPCHVTVVCATYQPAARANYVIEAKAGFAAANGIRVGTPVTIG
ncbi:MAG: DUF192 domain-containing protein [Nitrososphaerota archaeon]|nr:DUF192 domain-containing protein [Nitrososphaerota archaeon]MDG7020384.1 DUF192 domain-containing protein [Nitrososphaerota archaeon]